MNNLLDPRGRESLIKKIIKEDQELSKKFAFYCDDRFKINRYKNSLQFLNFSCNGIVWIAGLIAFSYFLSVNLIEMEVNLFLTLLLDIIVVAVIKAYIRRERPTYDNDPLDMGPNIFSFPSGYSSRVTLIFMFFTVLYPLPMIFFLPLYAWWFSICFTRVLLRKHFILDVLGGIVVALLEGIVISYFWIGKETAISIFDWISDEKTVGSDAEVL